EDGIRDFHVTGVQTCALPIFHHPGELPGEVADAGLVLERIVSVEGPVWMMGERLGALLADPDRVALLLESLRGVEEEPSLLGAKIGRASGRERVKRATGEGGG